MLVHCYPILQRSAVAVAQPFRRLARHAVGPDSRTARHGVAASTRIVTVAEVCRRVPEALPAWFGALAPVVAGAGTAGVVLAAALAARSGAHEQGTSQAASSQARPDAALQADLGLLDAIPGGGILHGRLTAPWTSSTARPGQEGATKQPGPIAVAEPATLFLLAIGGLGTVAARRRGRITRP